MKRLSILIFILLYGLSSSAYTANRDSTAEQPQSASPYLDSLQQQLKLTTNDSLKSILYTQLAAQYLKYDTISNKNKKFEYQNQALNYTMMALHLYSRANDTTGLRICFDNLARVYRSQRKFSQAKWFILQSNTLSRAKNDVPNIMASLIELAAIKMDIKDYNLAMRDLNEALTLSSVNHYPKVESTVQESYALLYSHLKNYTKEAIAIKRHNAIDDSIRKAEEAALTAQINARDSAQAKKKLYTTDSVSFFKGLYLNKTASLSY